MANNANATKKNPDDGPQVKVKNYSPGYMEQATSRGHEASPQSGLGGGCKLRSSSKKLRGLSVRAQAWRISAYLLFSVLGVSVDDYVDGHGEQPGPTPGGGAGRSENLQGGRKTTGGNRPTGRIRLYREESAQLYRAGGAFPIAADVTWE